MKRYVRCGLESFFVHRMWRIHCEAGLQVQMLVLVDMKIDQENPPDNVNGGSSACGGAEEVETGTYGIQSRIDDGIGKKARCGRQFCLEMTWKEFLLVI